MRYLLVVLLSVVALVSSAAHGEPLAGLKLSGTDTITFQREFGIDFVEKRACTTWSYSADYGCYNHIAFEYLGGPPSRYELGTKGGYGVPMGEQNVDSIADAPSDSVFSSYPLFLFEAIPRDSLAQYIGNVYVIKTGVDPRPTMGTPVYAKIKILDFTVRDAANHEIDMVFLWVANITGYKDLATGPLDMFTLDYDVDTIPETTVSPQRLAARPNRLGGRGAYRVVVGEDGWLSFPSHVPRPGREVVVFDAAGRVVARLPARSQQRERVHVTAGAYVLSGDYGESR